MKHTINKNQVSLFQFGLIKIEIKDNELLKMSEEIDWEAMIEIVGNKYSDKKGRNSKSLRMMIALEIAKRKFGLSDKDIVEQLKVDVALKIFCGFDQWFHEIPHPSSLTKFRNRLDPKTLEKLEEVNVKKMIRKIPPRKRYQVITDTTCVEANITYPLDSKLLSKTWTKLVEVAEHIRENGSKILIRGKRKVKYAIRSFNLKRKKSKKEILKMNKKLIRESKKLLKLAKDNINSINETKIIILEKAKEIIKQQETMIQNKIRRIENRIVSFHENEVRPIFRGKDGKRVEFGPKVAINVIGGKLTQTTKISNNNFSDTEMIDASLKVHNDTFGRDPTEIISDRGAHSPANHEKLKSRGIRDGIQYRGKIPLKANLPPPATQKRMIRQRSAVEGKIGTFKTKYKGNKNKYKNENALCYVSFGLIAMNASCMATAT